MADSTRGGGADAKPIKLHDNGDGTWSDCVYLMGSAMVKNWSTTAQTPSATVRTYIAGTALAIPSTGLLVGSTFTWTFDMTKTGAGVAASTIDIAFGTAGTTADVAQVSFTKPAGTGVIDEAFCTVTAIVRGPLSASGVVSGEFVMTHNLAATGHAQIPIVVVNTISAAFDVRISAATYAGLCITTGTADAITIQQATGRLDL